VRTLLGLERKGGSTQDSAHIEELLRKREIFPAIQKEHERREISAGLKRVHGGNLSFHIFHQDACYMHQCAEALRLLLPVQCSMSMREEFSEIFTGSQKGKCEVTDSTFVQYEYKSEDDA
jgi:hypothetical protein